MRAKLKGAIKSADQFVYLKLVVNYDEIELMTVPVMYWGGDLNNLEIVKQKVIHLRVIQYLMLCILTRMLKLRNYSKIM